MSKIIKKVLIVIFAVILLGAGAFGGFKAYNSFRVNKVKTTVYPIEIDLSSAEANYMQACWIYDINDTAKHVGFADYVFVAKVDEMTGTSYRDVTVFDDGEIYATPYTNYKVTILQNIKGNLQTNASIPLLKMGGVELNKKTVRMYQGDSFPQTGNTYVFFAYAFKDGDIYVSDPNGNILLGETNKLDIKKISAGKASDSSNDKAMLLIEKYAKAYDKQDNSVEKGERYVSKYDLNTTTAK